MSNLRPHTQPASRRFKPRYEVQRIGTVNNSWQELLSLMTAHYDSKDFT